MQLFFNILTIINSLSVLTLCIVKLYSINKIDKMIDSNFDISKLDLDFWGGRNHEKKDIN